jgi:hypothetical protein
MNILLPFFTLLNMYSIDLAINPSLPFESPPKIVWVLPDPVCPYANIDPLYPSRTPKTTGLATF